MYPEYKPLTWGDVALALAIIAGIVIAAGVAGWLRQ